MSILLPPLIRHNIPELLDRPAAVADDLPSNLRDIRRLNRWLGGTQLTLALVRQQLRTTRTASLLDVATGSADIPLALHCWAKRRDVGLSISACDISPEVLAEAKGVVGRAPIALAQADARRLPWPDSSFDVVTCGLALHHFSTADAATVLKEMWRVARLSVIVTDLTRGYWAYAGTWLASHVVARNRLTRHDGPVSVVRAFTPAELRVLASEAGMDSAVIRRHPFFRQSLVARAAADG